MYLWLRWIYEFDFSADRSAVLLDINVTVGTQTSLVGWFVLPVQVNEDIDLECSGLLCLRQIEYANNGQLAIGQSQNGSCEEKENRRLFIFHPQLSSFRVRIPRAIAKRYLSLQLTKKKVINREAEFSYRFLWDERRFYRNTGTYPSTNVSTSWQNDRAWTP